MIKAVLKIFINDIILTMNTPKDIEEIIYGYKIMYSCTENNNTHKIHVEILTDKIVIMP